MAAAEAEGRAELNMGTIANDDGALTISVSAPGKVILYGEHSVLYGKLAIAGSLGLRTRITLKETKRTVCTFDYEALGFVKSFDLAKMRKYLLDVPLRTDDAAETGESSACTPATIKHDQLMLRIEEFLATSHETSHVNRNQALTAALYLLAAMLHGSKVRAFDLIVGTDLKLGAGCGSSASYSVCLAAVFLRYGQLKRRPAATDAFDDDAIALVSDWAYSAEKIMHGTPSGIDNTVCAHGSLLAFRRGSSNKLLKVPDKIRLLLVNTKIARMTKILVSNVKRMHERHEDVLNAVFDAIDKISISAVAHFHMLADGPDDNIYDKLADLIYMNHNLLRTLDVSHPQLDKICDILNDFGLRGKLTGAGGGGYAIAIVPPDFDDAEVDAVRKRLDEEGYEAVVTDIGGPGVTVDEIKVN